MKKKTITKLSMDEVMQAEDRTRPDAPAGPSLDSSFWEKARMVFPQGPKQQLTVRLDADVVAWFRQKGRGYQTRMNAVLRSYYEAHKNPPQK